MKFYFDMDNTLNLLYDVPNWLEMLRAYDPTPYIIAKPRLNLSRLARYLNKAQKCGHEIGVVSWLSKDPDPDYGAMVTSAKLFWLSHHLPSVKWDEIKIVPYGVNKWEICGEGILFDDEAPNRDSWEGDGAYDPADIFNVLSEFVKVA